MTTPQPTQVERPWRATVRTVFQFAVAIATLLPFIAGGIYVDVDQAPAIVGQVLAVAAIVTRIMAIKQVEEFLTVFFPWLAADPAPLAPSEGGYFRLLNSAPRQTDGTVRGASRDRALPGKSRIRARRQPR